MAGKRNGLGKGLDSLIPNKTVKEESASQQKVSKEKQEKNVGSGEILVKINEVEPNREQPRKEFDEDSLMELADSIRQFGILQPLLVQKKKDYYEIIAGERRWRAAKLAGIKDVPIIVKNYTDQEIVEISLIENIQRENLNPIEEAMAYKRLLEEFDLKQDENYTYLYYNWNKVYYWDHVSKLMPFTWDEACDDLFSVMQNTLPENQIWDWKQKIWEKMSLSSQKTCIKTNLLNSISVIKIDWTNYYIVERKKYENKADNFIFDILSNKVFLSNKDLNDFDNILNTYYSNKYWYE